MPSDTTPLGGEPPVSGRFLFEVDGVEIGIFSEVSGLQLNVEVEEYAEGGQNGYVHKLPARMTWPNIVFRRGVTDSDALFDWVQKSSGEGFAANGNKLTRSTGAVTIIGWGNKRLRSWNLDGVFPIRWTGPKLSVNENVALEEELEVAHDGFRSKTS
jgi:phage tail-like protein